MCLTRARCDQWCWCHVSPCVTVTSEHQHNSGSDNVSETCAGLMFNDDLACVLDCMVTMATMDTVWTVCGHVMSNDGRWIH